MRDSAAEREWKIVLALTLAVVFVVGSLHSAWKFYVATGNPVVLVELTGFWTAALLVGWQSWRLRETDKFMAESLQILAVAFAIAGMAVIVNYWHGADPTPSRRRRQFAPELLMLMAVGTGLWAIGRLIKSLSSRFGDSVLVERHSAESDVVDEAHEAR